MAPDIEAATRLLRDGKVKLFGEVKSLNPSQPIARRLLTLRLYTNHTKSVDNSVQGILTSPIKIITLCPLCLAFSYIQGASLTLLARRLFDGFANKGHISERLYPT